MPLASAEAPLTYSVPFFHVRPPTKFGDPSSLVALPPLSRNTPPLGICDDSEPPSPSNTLPPPKANDVGVVRPPPCANSFTFAPLTPFGGGGGPPAAVALATTPPVVSAAVAAINAAVRPRMCVFLSSRETRAGFTPRPRRERPSLTNFHKSVKASD